MVWRWSHDAATWMRSDPSREVQLQVDLCSQVPSCQGGLLHHLEFADWCSKTLALPARIPISLGSHCILFPACKKLSALHTSWLHLALWHSLSHSCGYCALSELIIVTGVLKTDIPMWNYGNINQLLGERSRWSVQRRLPVTIQLVHDEQPFAGSSREGGGIGVEGKIQESAGQWKKQNSTYGDEVVSTVAPSSPAWRGAGRRSRRVFGRGGRVRGGLRGGGGARLQLLCQLWRLCFPSWMCLLQGSRVPPARKVSNSLTYSSRSNLPLKMCWYMCACLVFVLHNSKWSEIWCFDKWCHL